MGTEHSNRRDVLSGLICSTVLLSALTSKRLFAGGKPDALDRWARDLITLNRSLHAGDIDAPQWQARVETLNRSVPVEDLIRYLDIDALTRRFSYPSNLAETAEVKLPAAVLASAGVVKGPWFVRVFGLRKGGAVIPHVHNQMVSAHLVVRGSFRVRTHDRVRDLPDAVVLKPTRDVVYGAGEVLSMSEVRDNQHWFVALEDHSMTFDVGVVNTGHARADLTLPANRYNMIFVDVDRPPESSGLVVAPTMSFEACARKYAQWVG